MVPTTNGGASPPSPIGAWPVTGSDTVLYFTKKEDEAQIGTGLPSHSSPGTQSMHLEKELLLKNIIPSPPFRDNKTGVLGEKEVIAWGGRKLP